MSTSYEFLALALWINAYAIGRYLLLILLEKNDRFEAILCLHIFAYKWRSNASFGFIVRAALQEMIQQRLRRLSDEAARWREKIACAAVAYCSCEGPAWAHRCGNMKKKYNPAWCSR